MYEGCGITYAAVAPKVSNGFATVAYETKQRNSTINPVIQAKLAILLLVNSKIQSGAMSIAKPTKPIITKIKPSIRSSEMYNSCLASRLLFSTSSSLFTRHGRKTRKWSDFSKRLRRGDLLFGTTEKRSRVCFIYAASSL